jgi:hypothetical protein
MSLSQDSFAFLSMPHGQVCAEGPFELAIIPGRFFGVRGEAHLVGETGGRNLYCDFTLRGYETPDALHAALEDLESRAGTLTGALTMTVGSGTRTFQKCTFLGFQPDPRGPFYEGSNQGFGWMLFGRLLWRQRNYVADEPEEE